MCIIDWQAEDATERGKEKEQAAEKLAVQTQKREAVSNGFLATLMQLSSQQSDRQVGLGGRVDRCS